MSKRFILISAILTSIGIGVEWGMGGFPAILGTVFDISLIALFVTLVRIIITLSTAGFLRYFSRSFLFCGSILGAISFLLMLFAFIANSFPGSLSEIRMTNGKRQIVFMQMSHIGTQEYYDTVNHTLENLSASGYAIYREGVRPGTQENTDRFDRTLGVKISSGTYADFASLVGLVAQDDQIFSRTRSGSVRSVDLSLDQIITLMGTGGSVPSESPLDPSKELQSLRNSHTGPLFGYIIRGLMNFSLSYIAGTDIALEAMDPALRDAILTKRNNHLVETFLADSTTDVVIVYGALHFEGVYSILRSKDPEWRILSIKPYYPYKK